MNNRDLLGECLLIKKLKDGNTFISEDPINNPNNSGNKDKVFRGELWEVEVDNRLFKQWIRVYVKEGLSNTGASNKEPKINFLKDKFIT